MINKKSHLMEFDRAEDVVSLRSVKQAIRTGVNDLPGVGPTLLVAYRKAVFFKRWATARLRSLKADNLPDPETVYWLDPARIVLHTNYDGRGNACLPKDRVFHMQRHKGQVIDGNWDISTYAFEDLDVVQALRQRIESGVAWSETDFYARLQREVRSKTVSSWNIHSEEQLDERCEYLDRLVESIKQKGFRLSHEVCLENETKGVSAHPVFGSEITVNIGRNGQYLFQDGRHRLAIAKILGIKRVPVKVLVRHTQWVKFRQFMRAISQGGAASSRSGQLYQNPVHPDLQDIPFAHACEDRLAALTKSAGPGSGSLLDIGANLGFFCHGFEELGYNCFAVERLPECARAAEKIRDSEGKTFTVIAKDLFTACSMEPLQGRHFDVVLALNIFHHFIKQPDIFEKFTSWLRQLQVKTMFFEPHCSNEPQMVGAFANFDEGQFVEFILESSNLKHSELIHRCDDGRPIYRLWC